MSRICKHNYYPPSLWPDKPCPNCVAEGSFATPSGSPDELANLRRRVKAQRRELRRLNKEMSGPKAAYWWGFRKGLDAHAESELRGKMNKVFGYQAVWEAEHGTPYPERSQPNAEVSEPGAGRAESETGAQPPGSLH